MYTYVHVYVCVYRGPRGCSHWMWGPWDCVFSIRTALARALAHPCEPTKPMQPKRKKSPSRSQAKGNDAKPAEQSAAPHNAPPKEGY